MIKSKYLIIGSLFIFILNFFTLLNLNFTKDQKLQPLGTIIALASVLLFLFGCGLEIKRTLKKKSQIQSQANRTIDVLSKDQLKTPIKRWIAFFILLWVFVIYPVIIMGRMSILQKFINEIPDTRGNIGAMGGAAMFILLAMIATIYPGIYLNPLIIFPLILLLLSFYFFFSHHWHKILDIILFLIVLAILTTQLVLSSLIGMSGS